eukprot:6589223-Prymnesium_polylepis.2
MLASVPPRFSYAIKSCSHTSTTAMPFLRYKLVFSSVLAYRSLAFISRTAPVRALLKTTTLSKLRWPGGYPCQRFPW